MIFYISNISSKLMLGSFMVLSLLVVSSLVSAHSQRDPTLPPAPTKATIASSESLKPSISIEPGAITIIVRNGRPHLLIDNLFYAQGDFIGSVKIELITEKEIWVSEQGIRHKVPLFQNIHQRIVTTLLESPKCVHTSSKVELKPVSCIKIQP